MRSRRRLAVVPFLLLALGACGSDDAAPEPPEEAPDAAVEDAPDAGVPMIEGRGGTELPALDENVGVLESAGEASPVVATTLAAGASETGQLAGAPAGPHVLRVVCTSSDGAPVTITVKVGESELTTTEAACVPVFQGGSTMTDSDAFEVPGGDVDVTVTAASESVLAVGLVTAG